MREIGREHDVIDADMVAHFDRDPLVLHREMDVFADVVARQFLQWLEAEHFLGPVEMPLVPEVHVFEPERDPPEPRFGEEHV
jgi:hypothetical protein